MNECMVIYKLKNTIIFKSNNTWIIVHKKKKTVIRVQKYFH